MIKLVINNKSFGGRTIIKDLYIDLSCGDFLVLTGPSGAGKSSLLSIIGMLDSDYIGSYCLFDSPIDFKCHKITSSLRERYFGYVFQDSLINEKQSIKRNLLCSLDYKNQNMSLENISKALEMVALNDINRKTSVLSGGEKQRLSLARALIKKPSILLADEPTAGLDKENKNRVMTIFDEFRMSGGIVVMVTHDIELITTDMDVINIKPLD